MTKKTLVKDIIGNVRFVNTDRVIENCCKKPKDVVEKVYSYYVEALIFKNDNFTNLKGDTDEEKEKNLRIFCIRLLNS